VAPAEELLEAAHLAFPFGAASKRAFALTSRENPGLTDQAACHIDPAIGADHARDPDTILVFASSGAAEVKSWTFYQAHRPFWFRWCAAMAH